MGIFRKQEPAQATADALALHLPPKPPAKHQTAADTLDYWCKQHNATYEVERLVGARRVRVHLPDGDVVSGTGDTVPAAVVAVVKKLEAR